MKRTHSTSRNTFASIALVLTLVTSILPTTGSGRVMGKGNDGSEKSLYARVGGYDAIAAVVDDFIGRLVADKRFAKFFVGHSEDSLKKIRQHIVDQFCAAAGGPCLYTGRDMKTTHHGLGITNADWDAAVKHLTAYIAKFKVAEKEKGELLAFVATLKKDIVEK